MYNRKDLKTFLPDDFYDKTDILQPKTVENEIKIENIDEKFEKFEETKTQLDDVLIAKSQLELYDQLEMIKEKQKNLTSKVVKKKQNEPNKKVKPTLVDLDDDFENWRAKK